MRAAPSLSPGGRRGSRAHPLGPSWWACLLAESICFLLLQAQVAGAGPWGLAVPSTASDLSVWASLSTSLGNKPSNKFSNTCAVMQVTLIPV